MEGALMSVSDRLLLRKRAIIETVNDELKNIAQVEHSRHECFDNFIVNLLGACMLSFWHPFRKVVFCCHVVTDVGNILIYCCPVKVLQVKKIRLKPSCRISASFVTLLVTKKTVVTWAKVHILPDSRSIVRS